MLSKYDRRRQMLVEGFNGIGLRTSEPMGAFYVFPEITSTGLTSDEFAEQLLREESVAVVPGTAFGQAGEGHVRCCYATGEAELREALVRIERFVKRRKGDA
jgi:aminotransferase